VEDDDSILQIKNMLEEKEGIIAEQIRLIYNGKQLNDQDTVRDKNITAGAMIHMVLFLRGGHSVS
jgi:ubiquitin-like protein Nedd8